jgi:pimeloyl-ACP methyl ester carboxylesterase
VKILAVLSFAQILGAASASSPPPTPAPGVLVCLERIAQAGTRTTYLAQWETSKLLARAAVHVEWIHGSTCQSSAAIRVYVDRIRAPRKELVLIPNAGHNAIATRSGEFLKLLIDRARAFAL